MTPARDLGLRLAPYVLSAASVAVVGLAAYALTRFVPLPHVSILFLAAVLTSAALSGFWPSVFAAVLNEEAGASQSAVGVAVRGVVESQAPMVASASPIAPIAIAH